MKIINKHEAGEWCLAHGIPLNEFGLPAVRAVPDATDFPIPGDAGQRIALAKDQMGTLVMDVSCLVWLDDWNAWPSGQWHHLFERFRLSYECQAPMIERPAHIVGKDEVDAAVSIVVYAVLMLWDCYVITDRGSWVHYSHNEVGKIRAEASMA